MTLGAFVHFLKPPPRELTAQSWHFGLTPDSFRRFAADPWQQLAASRRTSRKTALTFRMAAFTATVFAASDRAAITCTL